MRIAHQVIETPHVPGRGPYAHAVRAHGFLFIAGQAGMDPATSKPAGATFELQARQAFENLRAILADCGSNLQQVVKTTCFLADPDKFESLNALFSEYFPANPPVRSTPIAQLPRGLLFSIEAIAALPPAT